MRHIMHTVEHAALIQAAADFTPHDRAGTPYAEICTPPMQKSAHPLCRNLHTNNRREP